MTFQEVFLNFQYKFDVDERRILIKYAFNCQIAAEGILRWFSFLTAETCKSTCLSLYPIAHCDQEIQNFLTYEILISSK